MRDDARVHVAALLDPSVSSQRLFPHATPFTWTEMTALLQKLRPHNDQIPDPAGVPNGALRDNMIIPPREKTEALIKSFFGVPGYVGLEESVEAGIAGCA